jgi:hypothetical protein
LKNSILALTPFIHQSNEELDEKVDAANALCSVLEQCFLEGLIGLLQQNPEVN